MEKNVKSQDNYINNNYINKNIRTLVFFVCYFYTTFYNLL